MALNPKNLKITVPYRQSGGQQVGDSPCGVEIEHLPTGIKVFCDYERSQIRNKKIAMLMIEMGLAELNINDE
jgi:peptide chain release factor 1